MILYLPTVWSVQEVDTEQTEALAACVAAQRDVIGHLHSSVLSPLCGLAKARSLAQLACCHRLQRTLDVQARALELTKRLNTALRQRHGDVGLDSNDDARRRSIGKLQQVFSSLKPPPKTLSFHSCLSSGVARL